MHISVSVANYPHFLSLLNSTLFFLLFELITQRNMHTMSSYLSPIRRKFGFCSVLNEVSNTTHFQCFFDVS
uniref:Secreted protein n=1 Tax=Caenorhabditis tropicalis TaxID=1561998 RepID=A0A1I7T1X9_9PELO